MLSDMKELMEQKEKQDRTIRKLKKQLKLYVKRVEAFEGELHTGWSGILSWMALPSLPYLICGFLYSCV